MLYEQKNETAMIVHLRTILASRLTIEQFRQRPGDFSRQRLLTFARLTVLILRGHKLALQNALNKAFAALADLFRVPTASAYCQARQKLKPELFAHLNQIVCQDFYQLAGAEGALQRWRGHRLLASDGTYLTLPDNPDTRAAFSVQTNQYDQADCVQALCCVLYDLRNDLGLAAALGKRQGEKKLLFAELWPATQANDVLVFDRHYADYAVLAYAQAQKRHVIVRLPQPGFAAARAFWSSQAEQQLLDLPCPVSARAFVAQHGLPESLRVRLIRVILDNGSTEVLLTTLLDSPTYPASEFKQVYGWRWGEETFFDRLKNIFEAERFSGQSVLAIKQDFYGVLFLDSLESILSKPDEAALQAEAQERQTQTTPQVNHAVSYVALVERVVQLLVGQQSVDEVLNELHHLFRKNPTRARPGRQLERNKQLRYAYRLRFHKYVKKLLA
jgi:hypothetical protein